jgi:hypothetical protein
MTPRDIKPYDMWRIDFGPNNLNNELLHIRAIVDDNVVVYRTWLRHKRRWRYSAKYFQEFEWLMERGVMKRVGKDLDIGNSLVILTTPLLT